MIEGTKPSLAILTSGHNLAVEELLRAGQNGELEASIELVISSNGVDERLAKLGARVLRINSVDYPGGPGQKGEQSLEESEIIAKHLSAEGITLAALVGYSKKLRGTFLEEYGLKEESGYENIFDGKIIRSHQGPLPTTYDLSGPKIQELVIGEGGRYSAHTMHVVTLGHNPNRIFSQHNVTVRRSDTAKALQNEVALEEAANVVKDINIFVEKYQQRRIYAATSRSVQIAKSR